MENHFELQRCSVYMSGRGVNHEKLQRVLCNEKPLKTSCLKRDEPEAADHSAVTL